MEQNISQVMKILAKIYPVSTTTLNSMKHEKAPNAFKILISCLLSLRIKDEVTDKVTKELFSTISTPKELASMDTKKLEKIIFSTGHYHKKAATLKHVSQVLIDHYNSKVPNTEEELLSIKGIGRKTANIVLAFAFGKEVLPIDTHCHRIPNRIGWVNTTSPEKTEIELMKILPKQHWREFNSIFVQFGKDICLPISPLCSKCPINVFCRKIGVETSR
jgi:endonuclease-3